MVDHALLLKDLKKQVSVLEGDLRERSEDPTAVNEHTGKTFEEELKVEYHRAFQAERTAATYGSWREERVTQAAVAWALATVFVRFCEDNRLLEQPFIAGPRDESNRYDIAQELKDAWILAERAKNPDADERTDRDWLVHTFEAMSVSSVMEGLFDKAHNPMWTITPSHQAAKKLISFWRTVGDDGHLAHDFTDPEWNTRFLGDLYQDLSESAKKTYALLQTPEFVEEFILDHTLEPAIEEFGLDGNKIYQAESKGFRFIDPTCGSGHFLLGAFHRLLTKWRDAAPGVSDWDLIARTLRSVHGVDKNPFAVAIARFRLLTAAMKEGAITTISPSNPHWPVVVATGDSLLHGRGAPGRRVSLFDSEEEFHRYAIEDIYEYFPEFDLLGVNSYHAVVGNPPYIRGKDSRENENYRNRYATCHRQFSLSVPFAERFFNLAVKAGGSRIGAGFIGKITANSFMKREFGKILIEEFFSREVQLTHVIDASGAYIPGHGTPAVILFGRNMVKSSQVSIRAVMGIRGEPRQPENAASGFVWSSIVNQIENPGSSESVWVSVANLPWDGLNSHPWSLSGGGAASLKSKIEKELGVIRFKDVVSDIGSMLNTREDDAYMLGTGISSRGVQKNESRPMIEGASIKDWRFGEVRRSIFPYDENGESILPSSDLLRFLWRNRKLLRIRKSLSGTQDQVGLPWYEYSFFSPGRYKEVNSIVFVLVASNPHFILRRFNEIYSQAATVVRFPGEQVPSIEGILGVLNSSTACFWLKQVSYPKGGDPIGDSGARVSAESWSDRYEFTGTKLKEYPLPGSLPIERSQMIDELAQRAPLLDPSAQMESSTPNRITLDDAYSKYVVTYARMIALQEELDWDVYYRYGLISDGEYSSLLLPGDAEVPNIKLGERAFEIVLARKMKAGEASTEWFNRHGSTPITEIPSHWPDAYKQVVAKRIEIIESRKDIALIERPECKRRWQSESWEKKEKAALKSWLLDKCEDRALWFRADDSGKPRPHPLSVLALGNRLRDLHPEAVEVAALYDGDKNFSEVITEIVGTEHVPYLAALRYKDTGLRKREEWEHVWGLQREEDALNADRAEGDPEKRLSPPIPVPPKYTSADFRKNTYWSNRGKLDVPKERFVSYPGAETEEDSSLVLGWAGWDHAEQAEALATLAMSRVEEHDLGSDKERMTPLLAGITELMPWVQQWHSAPDEYGQSMADYIAQDLEALVNTTGVTESDMAGWRPAAPTRGKKKSAQQ